MTTLDLVTPALEIRNASIAFGATQALRGVSLDVQAGTVHGLVGHNGSGKSSLVKIVTGVYRPAAGTAIAAFGHRLHLPVSAPRLARARIGVVHQDMGVATTLSVADNVLVNTHPTTRLKTISRRESYRVVEGVFSRLGHEIDPSQNAGALSEAEKAVLAFARALHQLNQSGVRGPGVLILDEVTARLGPSDTTAITGSIQRLRNDGWAVLFVGHRVDEIAFLCDSVTVLRDGQVAGTLSEGSIAPPRLAELITGGVVTSAKSADRLETGTAHPEDSRLAIRLATGSLAETCLEGRIGEVIGITGLADSGVNSIPYSLVGYAPKGTGLLQLGNKQWDLGKMTPSRALRHGIGLIPGDRIRNGIAANLTTRDNLAVSRHAITRGPAMLRPISRKSSLRSSRTLIDRYHILPGDSERRTGNLSGGNQQKVLVARALQLQPRLLIAHEPTAGVDVGARYEIFGLVREAATRGCTVIICSEDIDEVWDSADRILILDRGRVVASLNPATDEKSEGIHLMVAAAG